MVGFTLLIHLLIIQPTVVWMDLIASLPPMGWMPWTAFECNTDCKTKPHTCISEGLMIEMAQRLVTDGYRDVGYTRINLDDCWASHKRLPNGSLHWDESRFPHGIPWLAERVHLMGLKFGIYTNTGDETCAGFPGSRNRVEQDAKTFISWNVDMVKMDGCYTDTKEFPVAYPKMATALKQSSRSVVLSCSWPYYVWTNDKVVPPYDQIAKNCHMWRNFHDIRNEWTSIQNIIDFYDRNQRLLSSFHGPAHWNDPDALIIGHEALTPDQARTQMAMWCLWSAPLFISSDLREISPVFREILLNRYLIEMDQDPLGAMGRRVATIDGVAAYTKRLMPLDDRNLCSSYGIVLFNRHVASVKRIRFTLSRVQIDCPLAYSLFDVFKQTLSENVELHTVIEVDVPPTGVVVFKATPLRQSSLPDAYQSTTQTPVMCLSIFVLFVLFFFLLRRRRWFQRLI